jgi:ParB-like chromosome segregation protein Spo0J
VSARLVAIDPRRIRPFGTQPRSYLNTAEMAELDQSIRKIGHQVEIIVKPVTGDPKADFEIIDGEGWRWCLKLARLVRAIVREVASTDGFS